MARKRWKDLRLWQRSLVVLGTVLQIGLVLAALSDIYRRPAGEIRGRKWLWALASFANFVGPLSYFAFGRRGTIEGGSSSALQGYRLRLRRWLYRGGRPNALARALNRVSAALHASGVAPDYMVTLEVVGRRSGRAISFPLVMAVVEGERYLVSMLGPDASWVLNLRASDGHALLRHGHTESVRLEEVPVGERARVLKVYLRVAPGARPHVPVDKDAPLHEFDAVAGRVPVFRVSA